MKKYTIYATIVAFALIGFVSFTESVPSAVAQTVTDNSSAPAAVPTTAGSNTSVSTPVSSGSNADTTSVTPSDSTSNNSGGTSGTPTQSGSNDFSGTSGVSSQSGANNAGGTTGVPTQMGSNSSGGSSPAPVTPVTPTGGGGGGSTSSSGSYIGGGFSAVPLATNVSTSTATTSCPLLTVGLLKMGLANDRTQVAKLQAFLKDSQHLSVTVSGTFDQATEQAVEAFQKKYLSDIMGPWGATKASGVAYITTIKKINEIACAEPLTLDAKELSVIDAYKAALAAGTSTGAIGVNNGQNVPALSTSSALIGPTVGTNGNDNNQNVAAAAVAKAGSLIQRFWSFIVGLFHH
ncbi:MAG: peptidoglycan-binding protein [Patescibacteria group bacterium]|nr:peptidoglycan-binding protein [Patescibacteria group bacterium]